jgi:hypothetical protein
MALPGLVAAKNLADVADKERAWDNLGLNVSANVTTPESLAYIAAVEAADGAFLEEEVKQAIHAFVVGCKIDGIWPAIKASCILAGARTLNGALVPLVGTAPTNFNFASGDYSRKTGLQGGPSKYLNINRQVNADPQNNASLGVYYAAIAAQGGNVREIGSVGEKKFVWGNALITPSLFGAINNSGFQSVSPAISMLGTGLKGGSRSNATNYQVRVNGTSYTVSATSEALGTGSMLLGDPALESSQHTRSFYWVGESLDLALLDARVTTLINAFAAAIP